MTRTNIGSRPSSVGVVHDLARNTIATVISKIGSKVTIEELTAGPATPRSVPSVTADNNVSPNNPAIIEVDDRQTIGVQEVASLKTMAAHTPKPTTSTKEEKCVLNSEKRLANLFGEWLRSSVRLT